MCRNMTTQHGQLCTHIKASAKTIIKKLDVSHPVLPQKKVRQPCYTLRAEIHKESGEVSFFLFTDFLSTNSNRSSVGKK